MEKMITKQQADDALKLLRDYKAQIIKDYEERMNKEIKDLDEEINSSSITPQTKIKDLRCGEIWLNARTYRCILTVVGAYLENKSPNEIIVADLVVPGEKEYYKVRNCGKKTVDEIVQIVNKAGLEMPKYGGDKYEEHIKWCKEQSIKRLKERQERERAKRDNAERSMHC